VLDLRDFDLECILPAFPNRQQFAATFFCPLHACEKCACGGAFSCT
jgi:hypothetical protein